MSSRPSRVAWTLVVVWMAALAWGSLTPPTGLPVRAPDYLLHGLGYLLLAWLLRRALGRIGPARGVVVPALIAVGYGVLLEALQGALPYRSVEMRDVLANVAGACLAMVIPVGRGA